MEDEVVEPPTTWPLQSRHILVRTMDGQPPQNLPKAFERRGTREELEEMLEIGTGRERLRLRVLGTTLHRP